MSNISIFFDIYCLYVDEIDIRPYCQISGINLSKAVVWHRPLKVVKIGREKLFIHPKLMRLLT